MSQHYRTLLSIGIPIMIGQMGMIVLSFADTMMVGHHSTTELGAASFVNNIINLAIITGTGFSYGLTPVVGALFGRGEQAEAGQALRCSLLTNTLAAVAMMTVLLVLYFNLGNLGQPVELLGYMRPYYMVLFASLPFVMLFNAFKQFTDSITLTGGCAKNEGLKVAIEHVLKLKVINLKTDPQLMGALGAAEYARQKGMAKGA